MRRLSMPVWLFKGRRKIIKSSDGNKEEEGVGNKEEEDFGNQEEEGVGNQEEEGVGGNQEEEDVGNQEEEGVGNKEEEGVGNQEEEGVGNKEEEAVGNQEDEGVDNKEEEDVGNKEEDVVEEDEGSEGEDAFEDAGEGVVGIDVAVQAVVEPVQHAVEDDDEEFDEGGQRCYPMPPRPPVGRCFHHRGEWGDHCDLRREASAGSGTYLAELLLASRYRVLQCYCSSRPASTTSPSSYCDTCPRCEYSIGAVPHTKPISQRIMSALYIGPDKKCPISRFFSRIKIPGLKRPAKKRRSRRCTAPGPQAAIEEVEEPMAAVEEEGGSEPGSDAGPPGWGTSGILDGPLSVVFDVMLGTEDLMNASQVCRAWRTVAKRRAAWRCKRLENREPQEVVRVVRFAPCLGMLHLTGLESRAVLNAIANADITIFALMSDGRSSAERKCAATLLRKNAKEITRIDLLVANLEALEALALPEMKPLALSLHGVVGDDKKKPFMFPALTERESSHRSSLRCLSVGNVPNSTMLTLLRLHRHTLEEVCLQVGPWLPLSEPTREPTPITLEMYKKVTEAEPGMCFPRDLGVVLCVLLLTTSRIPRVRTMTLVRTCVPCCLMDTCWLQMKTLRSYIPQEVDMYHTHCARCSNFTIHANFIFQ